MPEVTLLRTKYVRAWPAHPTGEFVEVVPLAHVLTWPYDTDAHFTQYASPIRRRLSKEAPAPLADGQGPVEMTVLVFDLDAPGHQATDAWRAEMRERVARLQEVHPNCVYYATRGGGRIVYALAERVLITSNDDARAWSRMYVETCAYLERRFGIVADVKCCDWTRLFRAPRATRERLRGPENHPLMGDPCAIGSWRCAPDDRDRARARELVPSLWPGRTRAAVRPRSRDGMERYARAALEGELAALRATSYGQRNPRLYRAAYRLSSLGLDPALVRAELDAACSTWGHRNQRKDRATIERGIRDGLAQRSEPRRTP